jgi:hypothetical protein
MPSIDERVVAMSFENSSLRGVRVSTTLATLGKLKDALAIKNIGQRPTGSTNIEKAADKVTLERAPCRRWTSSRPSSAAQAPGQPIEDMGEIDRAGNKVTLERTCGSGRQDFRPRWASSAQVGPPSTDIEKAADTGRARAV